MRPPITERQALEWSYRFVDGVIREWIARCERHERIASRDVDPLIRNGAMLRANTYMQCAYELKDLESVLRVMTAPDKPTPRKLKLVIDNPPKEI